MLRVGVIGYGAIGRDLVAAIAEGKAGNCLCPAVLVRRRPAEAPFALTVHVDEFLSHGLDLVVECAGHDAVIEHGETVLLGGADLMVTSIGALVDDDLRERLLTTAAGGGRRLILPAAGIGALDMLSAAAVGELEHVLITVRKDPSAWIGTPAERQCDLAALAEPLTIYEGPVREGARLYPANVNISAAAALASVGPDRAQLRIVADPGIDTHVVEIEAAGEFGRMRFVEDVAVSDANRKTGRIVSMALVKALRQMTSTLVVGV